MCQHELRGLLFFIIFILTSMKYEANHDPFSFWFSLIFAIIALVQTMIFFVKEIKK